jgi:hypothetical protein
MNMQDKQESGFYILPFGIDGEPVGIGFWDMSKLSEDLLCLCKEYLELPGTILEASRDEYLLHIRTKMTSTLGTAVITFLVHGRSASSVLLMSGLSPLVENDVEQLFVDSLSKTILVQSAAGLSKPFDGIISAKERPLMIVVPWPDANISDKDYQIIRDLSLHLAAVFFKQEKEKGDRH